MHSDRVGQGTVTRLLNHYGQSKESLNWKILISIGLWECLYVCARMSVCPKCLLPLLKLKVEWIWKLTLKAQSWLRWASTASGTSSNGHFSSVSKTGKKNNGHYCNVEVSLNRRCFWDGFTKPFFSLSYCMHEGSFGLCQVLSCDNRADPLNHLLIFLRLMSAILRRIIADRGLGLSLEQRILWLSNWVYEASWQMKR